MINRGGADYKKKKINRDGASIILWKRRELGKKLELRIYRVYE